MDIIINKEALFESDYRLILNHNYISFDNITKEYKKKFIIDVMEYFEDVEDYEKCAELKKILDLLV